MAIRIRVVDGVTVALCAAKSVPKEGDVYLDDNIHYALTVKFMADLAPAFGCDDYTGDELLTPIIEAEESNNPNRERWDATYGKESLTE